MKAIENPLPVFVYGTLRPGCKNYRRFLRGRTRREEPATAPGVLYFFREGGYPCLLPGPGRVRGELMELDPDRYARTLAAIDKLEEYDPAHEEGSVYLRRRTRVRLPDGRRKTAWIYYWNRPRLRLEPVPGNDFANLAQKSGGSEG